MTDFGNGYDFLSIWPTEQAEPNDKFFDSEEDFIRNSFVFKSFRTEFEIDYAFSANGIKLLKRLKLDSEAIVKASTSKTPNHLENVPGYSRLSNIQKKSVLSKEEMDECFMLFNSSKLGQLTKNQLERYNIYRDKINTEQSQYLTLAKNNWIRSNFKRHAETLPEVLNMINKVWKISLNRVSKYPLDYTQSNLISLVYQCTNPVEMNVLQVVKLMGNPVSLFEPALRYYRVNLHSAITNINGTLDKKLERPCFTDSCEVSEDQMADELARENGVNIVISSSAFIALLNNHYPSFCNSWDIPVTIKEHKTENGTKKTIVYIDKPLPVKSMNISERNKLFSEIGCEYVLKYKFKEVRSLVPQPEVVDQTEIECNKSDINEESNSDEENTESSNYIGEGANEEVPPVTNRSEMSWPTIPEVPKNEEEENWNDLISNSSNSDDDLVIADAPDYEDTSVHLNLENETIPHAINDFVPPLTPKKKRKKKNKTYPQTSYTLWSLKKSSQVMLSKTCSKDLKLLIRCNEGYLKFPVEKGAYKQKWILSTKLEYQTEFGAEAMTLNELTCEWGNLYIRPNTKLLRARVDPTTGEVIMFERKMLSEVAAECMNLHKVNLMSKLASVYSIMEKLADHSPGRYHLSHMQRNAAFVPVYKECEGANAFNLRKVYNFSVEEVSPERSPWIPIDVNVLTPTFRYLHRVPAMFTPYKTFASKKNKGFAKKLAAKKTAAKKKARMLKGQKKNRRMKKKTASKKNPPLTVL